jgi:hypothetical protein
MYVDVRTTFCTEREPNRRWRPRFHLPSTSFFEFSEKRNTLAATMANLDGHWTRSKASNNEPNASNPHATRYVLLCVFVSTLNCVLCFFYLVERTFLRIFGGTGNGVEFMASSGTTMRPFKMQRRELQGCILLYTIFISVVQLEYSFNTSWCDSYANLRTTVTKCVVTTLSISFIVPVLVLRLRV